MYEEVVEAYLRLGDGAGGAVELGHHHRQPLALLVLRLCERCRLGGHVSRVTRVSTSAANRLIGEVVQSWLKGGYKTLC